MNNLQSVIFEPINLLFTVPMIVLAIFDFFSQFTENHRDFKNTIVGLGILGTFAGIFVGLQAFDPQKIQESIPPLLNGLKTAFWTSIAGMTISMVLTIFEALFIKKKVFGNEYEILLEIEKSNKQIMETLINSQMQQNQGLLNIETTLNKNFKPLQETLEKAFEKISEGATKEIIKALENVIQDFNKNLTEQFGENFKALNESVKRMIEWQDKYKESISEMERGLKNAISAIESSKQVLIEISSKNSEIIEVYVNLQKIIETYEIQITSINSQTESMGKLFEKTKTSFEEAQKSLEAFSQKIHSDLSKQSEETMKIISTTASKIIQENNQLAQTTNKGFVETKISLDALTEKIKVSLGNQSEAISKLNEEIKKQLPESLNSLGSALTTLTNQFKNDYEFFLSKIRELTSDLHRK